MQVLILMYLIIDPGVMPFGLGMHACMGRRLALRMVDAILYNFLQYDVTFYSGVVPSMFVYKQELCRKN